MKKLIVVISSAVISLVSVMYVNQLVKFLFTLIFGLKSKLLFSGITLNAVIQNPADVNQYAYLIVAAVPLVASIIFIELAFIWISKTHNEHIRSGLIIFQLVNIGYLIWTVIVGIISVLFKKEFSGEWNIIFLQNGFTYYQKLLILFLLMMLLLGYINILTKRVKKIIPIIK